jgi:hypothetical protein
LVLLLQTTAQQIVAVAQVVVVVKVIAVAAAAAGWSSFDTQTILRQRHRLQVRQHIQLVAATISMFLRLAEALHSDGTFCRNT